MIRVQRFRHLFKEGSWIVVGQAMVMIASLVGVRLLTGLLSPAEYGELALGLTIATLVNQTILGPLGQGVLRFYAPAVEDDDLVGYLHAVKQLVLISTILIVCLMLFGLFSLVLAGQYQWIAITISSLVFAGVSGYNTILSGIQNAARQRSIVAIHQGVEYWLRFLVAVVLINLFGANSTVAMIGYALGVTMVLCSQSVYFFKAFPNPSTWIDRKSVWQEKIWQYSWPMSVFGIFTWLQLVSDRWALGLFRTKDEVGMYAALFQLGYYPISMATGMAVQFLAPIFFQRSGDGSDARRNADVSRLGWRLTVLALGLTGVAFCIALLTHVQIFDVFVDKKYRDVSYLFPWIVLSGGIFSASQTIALNLLSQTKTYTMMPMKITTALLGIILNLIGGYSHGTLGIVMASLIFSIACFFSMAALSIYKK
jgi:O-antigen/teichoic acid export membrane protein